MGQNLDYLSTNQPTDEYTHKLQHRVLEMRDDKEWRENYMTWEMKLMKDMKRVIRQAGGRTMQTDKKET